VARKSFANCTLLVQVGSGGQRQQAQALAVGGNLLRGWPRSGGAGVSFFSDFSRGTKGTSAHSRISSAAGLPKRLPAASGTAQGEYD
jgi:hypothetical protein